MKRFYILSILTSIILFSACQNDSQITGPQSTEFQKAQTYEPLWIGLPQAADISLHKKFWKEKKFKAKDGGELVIDVTYTTRKNTEVVAYSSIYFPPKSLKKDCTIGMQIDDNTGVAEFWPHQTFNEPAILNQTFIGLDLSGIDVTQIKLFYIDKDGNYEVMEYDQLIIDVESGTIQVINGRIPHFSIYGFGI
ncbi:MAG: hypothetical protein KJ571_05305 [Bacteroidetes bacterium]|nr:hypothetical protein [Bacteroidota bacterium]